MASLRLSGICKAYGERRVLDDVGFEINQGRMTGFVGGNGAGKTTTMRILLGVLQADAGEITIDGRPLKTSDRRRFGYMPEERGLYPKMKVRDQLIYLARLQGWTADAAGKNAEDLIERLGLTERADDAVEKLSLGNQQRAQIAAALVHQPDVLVLDEPFSGLDPMAVDVVQSVLTDHAAHGVPVLFSSHQLDIVERLCDDLVIIAAGRIRAAGGRDQLRSGYTDPTWELVAATTDWVAAWVGARGTVVPTTEGVSVQADEQTRHLLLSEAVLRGEVSAWRPIQPSLAEIFREVVA
ncbi:MAG: ABC transporter ATP-binding protein [Nocardioides sp.]